MSIRLMLMCSFKIGILKAYRDSVTSVTYTLNENKLELRLIFSYTEEEAEVSAW